VLDRQQYDAANRDLIARFNRGRRVPRSSTVLPVDVEGLDGGQLERYRERFLASQIRRISAAARALVDPIARRSTSWC
jgi:hypothetical protein